MISLLFKLIACLCLTSKIIDAANEFGYAYTQVYSQNTCQNSDLTFTAGYAINTCIVEYNSTGFPLNSTWYNCSNSEYGSILHYATSDCSGESTEIVMPLDTCTNSTSEYGMNTGLSVSHRCQVGTPLAISTDDLPIFMNSIVTAGYPDNGVGCANQGIISFTAVATNLCFIVPGQTDQWTEITCNSVESTKTYYSDATCTTPLANPAPTTLPEDVCVGLTEGGESLTPIDYNQYYFIGECLILEPLPGAPTNSPVEQPPHPPNGNDDNNDDNYVFPAVSNGYVYYQFFSDAACATAPYKTYGYADSTCLPLNEIRLGSLAISYSTLTTASTTVDMFSYTQYDCLNTTGTSVTINLNTCMEEGTNTSIYYKVMYSADQNEIPVPGDAVVLAGYNSNVCNSAELVSFESIPLGTCIVNGGSGGSGSSIYSCDSTNTPVVTEYAGTNDCSGENVVSNLQVQCASGSRLNDDDYEFDVAIYNKAYCSSAPLPNGYAYTQVYSENTCSDSDLTYTAGYAINQCIVEYNSTGFPLASSFYTCSEAYATVTNYSSIDCGAEGFIQTVTVPLDTCEVASSEYGQSTGLSVSHRCTIMQQVETHISDLPIFMSSIVTAGYANNGVGCTNQPIISFTALATSDCFLVPGQTDQWTSVVCTGEESTQTYYSDATCTTPLANPAPTTLPEDVCVGLTEGGESLFPINYNEYYFIGECLILEPLPGAPTNSPVEQPPHPPNGNDDDNNDDYVFPAVSNGYVYYQFFSDAACATTPYKTYGYADSTCLPLDETKPNVLAISYSTLTTTSTTVDMFSYTQYDCLNTTGTSVTINLNTCMEEGTNTSIYYKVMYSADQNEIPVSGDAVVLAGYNSNVCNSAELVSFESIPLGTCIVNGGVFDDDLYDDDGYISGSSIYSCDSTNTPVVTEYAGSNDCSGAQTQKVLSTMCSTNDALNDDDYELDVSQYNQYYCNGKSTPTGYAFAQVYSADSACATSDMTYTAGYAINQCIVEYNSTGFPLASSFYTCSATTGSISNYTSIDCSPDTLIKTVTVPLDTCEVASSEYGQSTGLSVSHRCTIMPVATSVSALPVYMDSIVTAGFANNGAPEGFGCTNQPIISFTALATSDCFLVPGQTDQWTSVVCTGEESTQTYYSDATCTTPLANPAPTTLPEDVCVGLTEGGESLFPINYNEYYFIGECINSQPLPGAPTNSPVEQPPHPPNGNDDNNNDDYVYPNVNSGYVYYSYFSDEACATTPYKTYGYADTTCLPTNEQGPVLAISYSAVTSTSTSVTMNTYSSSDCIAASKIAPSPSQTMTLNVCKEESTGSGIWFKVQFSQGSALQVQGPSAVLGGYSSSTCSSSGMVSYQSIPLGLCITTASSAGTNNPSTTSTKYTCASSNGQYNVMESVFSTTGDCTGPESIVSIPNTCVQGHSDYSSFNDDDYNIDVAFNTKAVCMNVDGQPTPAPSKADIVKFNAMQNIVGCTIEQYNSASNTYDDVLSLAISRCMTNVPAYDVTITSVMATSSTKNMRALTGNNIMVMYTVAVNANSYDGSDYDYFNSLTSELTKNVNDGNFQTYLNENALAVGATGLETATCTSVDISTSNPYSTDDDEDKDDDEDDLSTGAKVGIAIGVIIFAVFFAFGAYKFMYKKENNGLKESLFGDGVPSTRDSDLKPEDNTM